MDAYIKKYEGYWQNGDGHHVHISINNETTAHVSFLSGEELQPVNRPWFNNKPSIAMEAHFDSFESSELVVELWETKSGFCLHLLYEQNLIINGVAQDALVPSVSRYEEDDFLVQYYDLLGSLSSYTKCLDFKC